MKFTDYERDRAKEYEASKRAARRDQFAAQSLQGIVTRYELCSIESEFLAGWAVALADALIAELDRTASVAAQPATDEAKGE